MLHTFSSRISDIKLLIYGLIKKYFGSFNLISSNILL